MASTSNIHRKYDTTMGLMHSLAQGKSNNWNKSRIEKGVPWCLDNGVYADKFDYDVWMKRLEGLVKYKDTCLFIVMPDVIGMALETLMQFKAYSDIVKKEFGFPVAFVTQDGISNYADMILWDEIDCIFIGGSDKHKLGKEGGWVIRQAKKHNKWLHIGRVNSVKRILQFWRADSWDGTNLGFCPSNVSKFHAAVLQVRAMKQSKGLFDDLHSDVSHGDNSRQSI